MNDLKRFFSLILVLSLFIFLPGFSCAGPKWSPFNKADSPANPCEQKMKNVCNPCAKNACNPCAKNVCNPCGKDMKNACNPCGKGMENVCNPCGKKMKNPCNPCGGAMFMDESANPCAGMAADEINFFRKEKFKSLDDAIAYGKKLAGDPKLGESGDSCDKCHKGGRSFKKSFLLSYPHYVKMPLDVVSLDQMINFCMLNPMATKALPYGSLEMTGLAAYTQAVYAKEYAKKIAKNPCAKN